MEENLISQKNSDQLLNTAIASIRKRAMEHPEDVETIITELNSICNKLDPDVISHKKEPYPLISPEFATRMEDTMYKIRTIVGDDLKIPDLRFRADDLSRTLGIPLPSSTRKHKESLLQWFDTHWTVVEPMLYEWSRSK